MEHSIIEEVRQAAGKQKGQTVFDWLKEPEPQPEQEPEPPQTTKERRTEEGKTRTLSGLISSAQEAIGASWAAAAPQEPATSTSDSGQKYLSTNDSLQTAYTDSSPKTGDRANGNAQSTATKRTYARRRRNSSSSTSMSSLEDYQTPKGSQAQWNPASQTTLSGNTTQISSTPGTSALMAVNPGQAATPPLSPSPI